MICQIVKKLVYSSDNVKDLETVMNEEFKAIIRYYSVNKLSVNLKKTHYMVITSAKKKISRIKIADIEQKDNIKYLGIYLDEHLNWEYQIKHINNKIAKNIGIIYKLRYYLDFNMLKQLYYTLVYPYLNYSLLSWGNTYTSKLAKIRTKQNRCIRNICFAYVFRENATPYNVLGILKLDNIFKLRIAEFSYKIINMQSNIPRIFLQFAVPATTVISIPTTLDMLPKLTLLDQKLELIMECTLLNLFHQKFGNQLI